MLSGANVILVEENGVPIIASDRGIPVKAVTDIGIPAILVEEYGIPCIVDDSDFTPADLFSESDDGTVVDPSNSSQDAAGTTPAEEGDPVGRCEDQSGNDNPALQPVDIARPTLGFDGNFFLDITGVGISIGLTLPVLGSNVTVAYAGSSGVTILTSQTVSGAVTLPTLSKLYVWIVINRALTALETIRLTNYLNRLL